MRLNKLQVSKRKAEHETDLKLEAVNLDNTSDLVRVTKQGEKDCGTEVHLLKPIILAKCHC